MPVSQLNCHPFSWDRSDSGSTVLAASESISHDKGWRKVAANTMLLIGKDFAVEERPINNGESAGC